MRHCLTCCCSGAATLLLLLLLLLVVVVVIPLPPLPLLLPLLLPASWLQRCPVSPQSHR
jgi:hypothetical protein